MAKLIFPNRDLHNEKRKEHSHQPQHEGIPRTFAPRPCGEHSHQHDKTMVDQTEDDYPDGVSDEATCLARAGLRVTYDATNTPTGLKNPNVCYRIFSAPYHAAAIKIRTAVAAVDTTAGIIRVDPNPWLCDTTGAYQICPPVILGTLVYHDPWHLSTTFVGRLATLLNAAVPKV